MSESKEDNQSQEAVTAQVVEQYLMQHPDFFVDKKQLLEACNLASLKTRVISFEAGKHWLLEKKKPEALIKEMLVRAQTNDLLFSHTRALVLAMLEASDISALLSVVRQHAIDNFGVNDLGIFAFADQQTIELPGIRHLSRQQVQQTMLAVPGAGKPICGALRPAESKLLFADEKILSAVVLPLKCQEITGFLVFGSFNAEEFSGSMDTLFVNFIARALERRLLALLRHAGLLDGLSAS